MRRYILLAVLPFLLVACAEEKPPISESEMLPVVIDLHLADALSTQVKDSLHPNNEKNFDSLAVWTLRILSKNNLSQETFNKSMDWYRDHPDRLQKLYTLAADSVDRMKK
jgi:hypothetical protein